MTGRGGGGGGARAAAPHDAVPATVDGGIVTATVPPAPVSTPGRPADSEDSASHRATGTSPAGSSVTSSGAEATVTRPKLSVTCSSTVVSPSPAGAVNESDGSLVSMPDGSSRSPPSKDHR